MEISDLKVFKQVAESGGITHAAKVLNRVPSNVTARIQKLESELGKSLFIREKNRLNISSAGQQLLGYTEEILNLVSKARSELEDQSPIGQLKLGAMEAVMASRLTGPLKCFHQDYPDVQLSVQSAPTGTLIHEVLEGNLDIGFVADPSKDSRLDSKPLYEENLVVVSSLNHKPIKSPKDLGANPSILGFNHLCAYRNRLTNWLAQSCNVPNIIEINSYHTLLSCAAAGMGVGMVPEALINTYPFKENLQVHSLPKKWSKTITCAIWRKDNINSAMEHFIQKCATN